MVFVPLRLGADGHTDRLWESIILGHSRVADYDYCISERHSTGVTKAYAISPNCPLLISDVS